MAGENVLLPDATVLAATAALVVMARARGCTAASRTLTIGAGLFAIALALDTILDRRANVPTSTETAILGGGVLLYIVGGACLLKGGLALLRDLGGPPDGERQAAREG